MTLTKLLEVNLRLLEPGDATRLAYAESLWRSRGCPCEPSALCEVLELILVRSQREGIGYPPIVLKRKRQLERGFWKPRTAPSPTVGGTANASVSQAGCPLCRGWGMVVNPDGSGRFCSCEAGERQKFPNGRPQ